MSEIQLDKDAYQQLIDGDIRELEKYMPKYSLEKRHIIEVLKWSVKELYKNYGKPQPPKARVIREGTVGTCRFCNSTEVRRFWIVGKKIGCINPDCINYYKNKVIVSKKKSTIHGLNDSGITTPYTREYYNFFLEQKENECPGGIKPGGDELFFGSADTRKIK